LHLQLFVLTEVASLSATHGGRTIVSTIVIITSFDGNPYHPWLKSSPISAAIGGHPNTVNAQGETRMQSLPLVSQNGFSGNSEQSGQLLLPKRARHRGEIRAPEVKS